MSNEPEFIVNAYTGGPHDGGFSPPTTLRHEHPLIVPLDNDPDRFALYNPTDRYEYGTFRGKKCVFRFYTFGGCIMHKDDFDPK